MVWGKEGLNMIIRRKIGEKDKCAFYENILKFN
jgi:hypothetical protein